MTHKTTNNMERNETSKLDELQSEIEGWKKLVKAHMDFIEMLQANYKDTEYSLDRWYLKISGELIIENSQIKKELIELKEQTKQNNKQNEKDIS